MTAKKSILYSLIKLANDIKSKNKSQEMIKTIPATGSIDDRIEHLHFSQDNTGPLVFKFKNKHKVKCAALIEVANTPKLRSKGLSKRASLSKIGGMYFNKACTFWMKDTNFPLDLVFLDKHGAITEKTAMAVDKNGSTLYSPKCSASAHAIELPYGFCNKYGIRIGDTVSVSTMI
jgi:uncharacterized membrane protein (UPF0127 family)